MKKAEFFKLCSSSCSVVHDGGARCPLSIWIGKQVMGFDRTVVLLGSWGCDGKGRNITSQRLLVKPNGQMFEFNKASLKLLIEARKYNRWLKEWAATANPNGVPITDHGGKWIT